MGQGRDLVDSSVKTWNDHSLEAWAANFSDDAVLAAPGGVTGSGPQATKLFYSIWQDAFPDNQIRDVRIAEDGENVYLEAVFDGTHTASLNAPTGAIPATGKPVSIPFVTRFTCRRGQFTDFRLYFDQMDLVTQLGLSEAGA